MNQCGRIRLILQENNLKQKELAAQLGVTESYVSKLLHDPAIRLSQPLAALVEEKYGYCARNPKSAPQITVAPPGCISRPLPSWKSSTKASSGQCWPSSAP